MIYRTIGKTDLKVSIICLGTMTFGEQNSEQEAHKQMDYALDQGINFFDTAELYAIPSTRQNNGLTEKYIGSWFTHSGNRDKIILASKIVGPRPGISYIRPDIGYDDAQIRQALEGSLNRLKTDYIDLYQLHWPERKSNYFGDLGYKHDPDDGWEDNFLQIIETMDKLIQEGKIRYWGVSNETAWGVMHFLRVAERHGLTPCVSIQNPYNLLNRSYEVGLAEISIREDITSFGLFTPGFWFTYRKIPFEK